MSNVGHSMLVTCVLVALVAGCASRPEVRTDRDRTANMQSYRTFSFYDQLSTDRSQYSTLLSNHLKQATREQLERLNYVYSEESPDLKVNFFLKVADKQELRTAPGALGYRFYTGRSVETVSYRAGTLGIDLVDASRNALVWEGIAEGRVDSEAMKNPGPALNAVVGEIFAAFPDGSSN